jgi:hypothetical protein
MVRAKGVPSRFGGAQVPVPQPPSPTTATATPKVPSLSDRRSTSIPTNSKEVLCVLDNLVRKHLPCFRGHIWENEEWPYKLQIVGIYDKVSLGRRGEDKVDTIQLHGMYQRLLGTMTKTMDFWPFWNLLHVPKQSEASATPLSSIWRVLRMEVMTGHELRDVPPELTNTLWQQMPAGSLFAVLHKEDEKEEGTSGTPQGAAVFAMCQEGFVRYCCRYPRFIDTSVKLRLVCAFIKLITHLNGLSDNSVRANEFLSIYSDISPLRALTYIQSSQYHTFAAISDFRMHVMEERTDNSYSLDILGSFMKRGDRAVISLPEIYYRLWSVLEQPRKLVPYTNCDILTLTRMKSLWGISVDTLPSTWHVLVLQEPDPDNQQNHPWLKRRLMMPPQIRASLWQTLPHNSLFLVLKSVFGDLLQVNAILPPSTVVAVSPRGIVRLQCRHFRACDVRVRTIILLAFMQLIEHIANIRDVFGTVPSCSSLSSSSSSSSSSTS